MASIIQKSREGLTICASLKSVIPISKNELLLSAIILSMSCNNEDLLSFLQTFGFTEEELNHILDELNSSRTILGTTLFERYRWNMNLIIKHQSKKKDPCVLEKT